MTDDETPIDEPPETDPDDTDDGEDVDVEQAALRAAGIDPDDGHAPGTARNRPGPPNAILQALEHLGPSSATEIANAVGRATGNVSTRLRQMEEEDRVHRTGKSVNPGSRGGPQIEWAIGPSPNGRTGPETQVAQPTERGSFDARLRAMAERVAHANGRVEALEHERDAAAERARRSEAETREVAKQRDDARRRIEGMQLTLRELEAQRDAQAQDAGVAAAESNSMAQSELDDLAGLLGLPNADDHGEVRERVRVLADEARRQAAMPAERLVVGDEELERLADGLGLTARPVFFETLVERARELYEIEKAGVAPDVRARLANAEAASQGMSAWMVDMLELLGLDRDRHDHGDVYEAVAALKRELAVAAPDGGAVVAVPVPTLNTLREELEAAEKGRDYYAMRLGEEQMKSAPAGDELRLRYFEALMELARETRDEHVFDRIERLLEGGEAHE